MGELKDQVAALLGSLPDDFPLRIWRRDPDDPDGCCFPERVPTSPKAAAQAVAAGDCDPFEVLRIVAFTRQWELAHSGDVSAADVAASLPYYLWEVGLSNLPGVPRSRCWDRLERALWEDRDEH
jgi:hypothetical protein